MTYGVSRGRRGVRGGVYHAEDEEGGGVDLSMAAWIAWVLLLLVAAAAARAQQQQEDDTQNLNNFFGGEFTGTCHEHISLTPVLYSDMVVNGCEM